MCFNLKLSGNVYLDCEYKNLNQYEKSKRFINMFKKKCKSLT